MAVRTPTKAIEGLKALSLPALTFLITGNLKDFPESWETTRIVSARVFLAEFRL
jgi:hypothetical protein